MLVAYGFIWLGEVRDAEIIGGVVLCLNFIPAVVALIPLGLLTLAELSVHAMMLAWPPLTMVLGIPFWLWIDRGARARFERRVAEEVERRVKAGLHG
jgi:ABC-type glycerol-3-phosphate transport system permease component